MSRRVGIVQLLPTVAGLPLSFTGGTLDNVAGVGTELNVGAIEYPRDTFMAGLGADTPFVLILPPLPPGMKNDLQVKDGPGVRTLKGKVLLPGSNNPAMSTFAVIDDPVPFLTEFAVDERSARDVMTRVKSSLNRHRSAAFLSLHEAGELRGVVGVAPRTSATIELVGG